MKVRENHVLRMLTGLGLGLLLASCGGGDSDGSGESDDDTSSGTETGTETGADTDTGGDTDTDTDTDDSSDTTADSDADDQSSMGYIIVDTGQVTFYDDQEAIAEPAAGDDFYGQDAQFAGVQPSYTLSSDGKTVYDNNTGLTWTQTADLDGDGDIDADDKLRFSEAQDYPATLNAMSYGGYSDWRLPSMKELYSLMLFSGTDPSGGGSDTSLFTPFIDTDYFGFDYGDTDAGERVIDAQFWSSNSYVDTVFDGEGATFGLNLADGRIKGYPNSDVGVMAKTCYVYFVRGNTAYGINDFTDNEDGTITDSATGLMWAQSDSGVGMDWGEALAWVQARNAEAHLGYDDWRLPNAKELQSIVDYSRSPATTSSAAIDPIFDATAITNEEGEADYPWYWTGTTHATPTGSATAAVYICFGRALGYMSGSWMDVHGAGCQRSDPKSGSLTDYTYVSDGYYSDLAPQGDAVRIDNHVRLVRDAAAASN